MFIKRIAHIKPNPGSIHIINKDAWYFRKDLATVFLCQAHILIGKLNHLTFLSRENIGASYRIQSLNITLFTYAIDVNFVEFFSFLKKAILTYYHLIFLLFTFINLVSLLYAKEKSGLFILTEAIDLSDFTINDKSYHDMFLLRTVE